VVNWTDTEGAALPLGATWCADTQAWNFALYSKHAESVTLLLYGEHDFGAPLLRCALDYLRNKSGRIWHCRIPARDARGARYYAYSVSGPPSAGGLERFAFCPQKILLDPYARAVFFPPDFERAAACRPGSNAGKAPLGVLTGKNGSFDWGADRRPRHGSDTVIYELHVAGFTRSPSCGIGALRRGTYSGLIDKIPYLKDLGITVVELMPVFQFDPQEGNFWGYMPLSFFAPHHGYGCRPQESSQHDEFREMVKALHAADIEVILDVVYNHTVEAGERGPLYSYKGIDNSSYYILTGRDEPMYQDFSGTGNTLHCANRYVRKLIVDSLRYWVREMHVDGFRFDLASVFARSADGSLSGADPPIFGDILSDPDLAEIRLIAEPWDAAGAYQLGRGFPGVRWLQWNGRFRDDIRRFMRGDGAMIGALMQRLYGSDDLFPDDRASAFHAYQSVNFITVHDGFTLYDLVAYNGKHNEANGHGNADGAAENFSWNCGWEGDDGAPPQVLALRRRQAKNFCALLFLSNGTPMLRAGDEFLQTQSGNNNAYNQDNPTSWLNWELLERNGEIYRFFRAMIRFRKSHPSLGRSRFWRGDVRWFGTGPTVDFGPQSRTLAIYLDGESQQDVDLYILINASDEVMTFEIQVPRAGGWRLVLDTGLDSPEDFPQPPSAEPLAGTSYRLDARAVAVMSSDERQKHGASMGR